MYFQAIESDRRATVAGGSVIHDMTIARKCSHRVGAEP